MLHFLCMSKSSIFSVRGLIGSKGQSVGLTLMVLGNFIVGTTAYATPPTTDLSVTYPALGQLQDPRAGGQANGASGRFVAAPMPDQNASAPRQASPTGPAFGPGLFQHKAFYRGDGFTPDSSPQIAQQSKHLPLPGISMKVPLY